MTPAKPAVKWNAILSDSWVGKIYLQAGCVGQKRRTTIIACALAQIAKMRYESSHALVNPRIYTLNCCSTTAAKRTETGARREAGSPMPSCPCDPQPHTNTDARSFFFADAPPGVSNGPNDIVRAGNVKGGMPKYARCKLLRLRHCEHKMITTTSFLKMFDICIFECIHIRELHYFAGQRAESRRGRHGDLTSFDAAAATGFLIHSKGQY